MSEFKREARYIVIKRSDLKKVPVAYRAHLVDPMFALRAHLPRRKCLVIESDWPEYEPAWAMIEARMTGSSPQPPALGGEPELSGEYHADVDMLLAEIERQKGREMGIKEEVFDIVCKERDTLKARCDELEHHAKFWADSEMALKSALQAAPAAKCERCSASTVEHCDENNCGYLGSGNGAPAAKDGAQ